MVRRVQMWHSCWKSRMPCPPSRTSSVSSWRCISAYGRGSLHVLEGTMNAERYIKVLEQHMIPSRRRLFQQDNAKPHTAAVTTVWPCSRRVQVLNWPACSPDLSPIDNIWYKLDRRWNERTLYLNRWRYLMNIFFNTLLEQKLSDKLTMFLVQQFKGHFQKLLYIFMLFNKSLKLLHVWAFNVSVWLQFNGFHVWKWLILQCTLHLIYSCHRDSKSFVQSKQIMQTTLFLYRGVSRGMLLFHDSITTACWSHMAHCELKDLWTSECQCMMMYCLIYMFHSSSL